jgi:hypothetical protein
MKIYQIAGKHYAASGDDLYEKVPEFSLLEPQSEEDSASTFAPKRKKHMTSAPKSTKRGRKGKIHCKICDGYGHFAKTCPKRDGDLPLDEEPPVKREITKEIVDEVSAAHPTWDSLKIAAELKCRLSDVNKFW